MRKKDRIGFYFVLYYKQDFKLNTVYLCNNSYAQLSNISDFL